MPELEEQLRRYGEAVEAAAPLGSSTPTVDRRWSRRATWATLSAAAAVFLAVVAGVLVASGGDDPQVTAGSTTTTAAPRGPEGTWATIPKAPIAGRTGAAAVATSKEMIVWGGRGDDVLADGAAYSFAAGTWRALPTAPLSARTDALAVWTGEEVFVWGGVDGDGDFLDSGAAYDPATDRWRELPRQAGHMAARRTAAVWTGDVVVVTGVISPPTALLTSDTFAIDPASWEARPLDQLPSLPGDVTPRGMAAVWTGERVLAVTVADDHPVVIDTLDVVRGTWGERVTTDAPGLDTSEDAVVWTGSQLVIVGHYQPGVRFDPASGRVTSLAASGSQLRAPAVAFGGIVTVGDRWLEVATATWHEAGEPPGSQREFPVAITDGAALYVWGGSGCGRAASCSGFVDPEVGGRWTPPDSGAAAPGDFEVLTMREAGGDALGSLRAAVDTGELAALWRDAKLTGEPPGVDFDTWVVVSLTIPDDACPPTLTGFARHGDTLTPEFREPEQGCDEPLIPKTFVVAIRRDTVTPSFTLRLPAQPPYELAEQRLDVAVP